MEVFGGPVVVLAGADLAPLGGQLAEAVKAGWTKRGKAPPRELLDLAVTVNRLVPGTANGSGVTRNSRRSRQRVEPRNSPGGQFPASCEQPVMTVAEVAEAAEVSGSYVRRVVRRGGIASMPRDDRSAAYLLFTDSVAMWLAGRCRKENDRKAA